MILPKKKMNGEIIMIKFYFALDTNDEKNNEE